MCRLKEPLELSDYSKLRGVYFEEKAKLYTRGQPRINLKEKRRRLPNAIKTCYNKALKVDKGTYEVLETRGRIYFLGRS